MTNKDLLIEFNRIHAIDNPLDMVVELKKMNKIYKKSLFYKQTKMNIKQAYQCFLSNEIISIIKSAKKYTDMYYISDKVNEIIDGLDLTILDGFANKVLSFLDTNNLKSLQGELKQSITSLKKIQ